MNPLHVCFSLRDRDGNYSKYAAVAIASVLRNTQADVVVHLFHDDTVSTEVLDRLVQMVRGYRQTLVCYRVDAVKEFSRFSYMPILRTVSLATMFRLKIADLLPQSVDRVLYLDADTVTNLDIRAFWEIPFDDAVVIGKHETVNDFFRTYRLFTSGTVDFAGYVNAGVLFLNLMRIRREYHLLEESLRFFEAYPDTQFADSDALNYVFRGKTKLVDEKYNDFTKFHRGKREQLRPAIYHFAGDHPHAAGKEAFDQLFFQILSETPWRGEAMRYFSRQVQLLEDQYRWLRRCFTFHRSGRSIVFWGARAVLKEKVIGIFRANPQTDYFVDSDASLWGTEQDGLLICSPETLYKERREAVFIVVVSQRYYDDIRDVLQTKGFVEDEDFIKAGKLLMEDEGGTYEL